MRLQLAYHTELGPVNTVQRPLVVRDRGEVVWMHWIFVTPWVNFHFTSTACSSWILVAQRSDVVNPPSEANRLTIIWLSLDVWMCVGLLCWGDAASRIVKSVALYAQFCIRSALWLLQYDSLLWVRDGSFSLTKIALKITLKIILRILADTWVSSANVLGTPQVRTYSTASRIKPHWNLCR